MFCTILPFYSFSMNILSFPSSNLRFPSLHLHTLSFSLIYPSFLLFSLTYSVIPPLYLTYLPCLSSFPPDLTCTLQPGLPCDTLIPPRHLLCHSLLSPWPAMPFPLFSITTLSFPPDLTCDTLLPSWYTRIFSLFPFTYPVFLSSPPATRRHDIVTYLVTNSLRHSSFPAKSLSQNILISWGVQWSCYKWQNRE